MKTRLVDFLLAGIVIILLVALDWLLTAFLIRPLSMHSLGNYHLIADGLLFLLLYGLLSALFYRVLLRLRPLLPGDYAMEEPAFTRWKLVTVVYEFGRGALLPFTTVFARPLVAKLFGAKIGRDIALGGDLVDPYLIQVGDYAILGHNSVITAHAITSGHIMLREVRIGRGATVGVHVVVMPGVEIGEDAVVTAGSVVAMNTRIPPAELWGGIPARKIKDIAPSDIRG